MEENKFQIRGKVVQMARKAVDVDGKTFAEVANINYDTFRKIECEVYAISALNKVRILRGLQKIGITKYTYAALQGVVEYIEETQEEVKAIGSKQKH